MKLDYLSAGSEFCPFLRLYDFTAAEAGQLLLAAQQLAAGRSSAIPLHELGFINSFDCQLTLRISDRDRGIVAIDATEFACELSRASWSDLAGFIEPFAELARKGTFQWLIGGLRTADSPALLLSPDGQW
jgi:hypothetical protein